MLYLFLDESGDLGFDFKKKKTSKFFIVTFLATHNQRPIEKIVRKTYLELRKKFKRQGGVLHAFREKSVTRERLLKRLCMKECSIMTIYVDKARVYTRLSEEQSVLYNYITNILLDRIMSKKLISKENDKVLVIASLKDTNKFLNENFSNYLRQKTQQNHSLDIEVEIKTPHQEKALQAVDFASWAIFRKQEFDDKKYYNLIQEKIIEENPSFP